MQPHDLGPYFDTDRHADGAAPRPPWRPMSELLDIASVLDDRVAQVRGALAAGGGPETEVSARVAASVLHLGLVARVISPVLADAVSGRRAPVRLEQLWWQPQLGGAVPLSRPPSSPAAATDCTALGAWIGAELIEGAIAELTLAVGGRFGVSERVLWGNVASAINGACTVLGAALARGGRPGG